MQVWTGTVLGNHPSTIELDQQGDVRIRMDGKQCPEPAEKLVLMVALLDISSELMRLRKAASDAADKVATKTPTSAMPFTITVDGTYMGTYEASTESEALDAYARDAGYSDYAEAQATCGVTGENVRAVAS